MQIFDYTCKTHGHFELMRPLGLRAHPAPCPTCNKLSMRAYVAVPNVAQIDPKKKSAIERNIKSQFEPHICNTHNCEHEAPSLLPPSHNQKPKLQPYLGARPWVIEHPV